MENVIDKCETKNSNYPPFLATTIYMLESKLLLQQ